MLGKLAPAFATNPKPMPPASTARRLMPSAPDIAPAGFETVQHRPAGQAHIAGD